MKNTIIKYISSIHLFVLVCCTNQYENPKICIYTDSGNIFAELYLKEAEITASNFLQYVNRNLYDSSLFYRTVKLNNQPDNRIKIEVIQGGFKEDSCPKMLPPIKHESTAQTGIRHKDGVISMARNDTGTATSEFFICIGDQPELDFGGRRNPDGQGFAAFGRVYSGMDVVKNIQMLKDTNQFFIHPALIDSIRVVH